MRGACHPWLWMEFFLYLVNARQLRIQTKELQDPTAGVKRYFPALHAPQFPGRRQQLELRAA